MRRGFGIAGLLVTVILLAIVGAVAYNVGWSDGVNTHLPAATDGNGAPPYYYGYGFHPFFAGFGILWFLLFIFGIFWLFRLLFWGFAGRRMMMGGWGYGRGWGHGPQRWGSFEERAQEWHRQQHEGATPPGPTNPPSPPPPGTTSV